MLNTDEKKYKFTIKCINCLPLVYIALPSKNDGVQVVMLGITEKQEEQLDKGEILTINTDRGSFRIDPALCYVYGSFNLSPKSDDIMRMYKANWFNTLNIRHNIISNYDYKNHCGYADIRSGTWFNTTDLREYLPYLHGCIGKPERIAIFRESNSSLIDMRRKREHKNKLSAKYRSAEYSAIYARNKTIAKRKAKVSGLKFKIKK